MTPFRVLAKRGVRRFSTTNINAKVVRYDRFGTPSEVLRVVNEQVSKVNSNEVVVKMSAAPIHPADLNMIEGTYPLKATLPGIGGNEGAGVVVGVGNGVNGLKEGDNVIVGRPGLGTWRTHGVFQEQDLVKVPKSIPPALAAVISVNPTTALRLLEDFVDLKPGDVIVQNGANSMVGMSVIQLANLKQVKTINIVRNSPGFPQTVEVLKGLGGFMAVSEDYIQTPAFRRLLSDIPKPKLALNGVGGQSATELARILGDRGTMVTYGAMSRRPVTIPSSQLIFKELNSRGFWLNKWVQERTAEEKAKVYNQLFDLVGSGKLKLFVETWEFNNFAQALAKAQGPREHNRKVVLQMS